MRKKALLALAAAAALLPTLAACGSDEPTTAGTTPSTTGVATDSAPTTTAEAAAKVSANDATADELVAALSAAGVPSADRWAREIEEYRPYPDDPSWAKLRDELSKYNPSDQVLEAIISVLR